MIVGTPKEIKAHENRVGLTPSTVRALVAAGHKVLIQRGAGLGSSITDEAFAQAGAELVDSPEEVYGRADMIVKVKEPQEPEYRLLRKGQVLFCYLHLAANEALTRALVESGATAIAFETVEGPDRSLPLLTPMSEVAGRLAVQMGANYLQRPNGGRGVLMAGAPGVPPARVLVLGAGVVGWNAAATALGLGAEVTLVDIDPAKLRRAREASGERVKTLISEEGLIAEELERTDLLVGAVLVPGREAPKIVRREMLKRMAPGSVLVDVAIDQGGCMETSRPMTFNDKPYVEEGVLHVCITNMPSAVPATSTAALQAAIAQYVLRLAHGPMQALAASPGFLKGLNVFDGQVTCEGVAAAHGYPYTPPESVVPLMVA